MMKKYFKQLLPLIAALLLIIACKEEPDFSVTGVTIVPPTVTLNVGGTYDLLAIVAPSNALNKNVTWESSNTDIVRVNYPGHIEALALGTATITVTTEDGNKTATCDITVAPIAVTGVSLNERAAMLNPSSTITLNAEVTPYNATNANVIWESRNTAVATVSGGTVAAVAPGSTTITVTTEDGHKTDACAITVTVVTGVSLNYDRLTLYTSSTVTLVATVKPDHAHNKNVTWESSDPTVATVNDGIVTAVTSGETWITVATEDGNKTASCWFRVADRVEWAATNVNDYQTFAERPDMYTKFYQWNKKIAYNAQDPVTPAWDSTVNTNTSWTNNPCPVGWRVPSPEEFQALRDYSIPVSGTWAAAGTKGNAVAGRFFGTNSANCRLPSAMTDCVFFPASGRRWSAGNLDDQAEAGYYWTDQSPYALLSWYGFWITGGFSDLFYTENEKGAMNVRCVRNIQ